MGKKKVIQKSQEDILKETDVVESAVVKAGQAGQAGGGKRVVRGKVYISASYNNTIVTVTDEKGNALAWATAGSLGFSGPKKATPFAATKIVAAISEKLKKTGLSDVDVLVKGIGGGRDSAIRTFVSKGFNILSIKDITPVPHNGPRPKKVRRV